MDFYEPSIERKDGRWCVVEPVGGELYGPAHSVRRLRPLPVPDAWDRRKVFEWIEWRRRHGEPV